MVHSYEQFDTRFNDLRSWLPLTARPARGWVRAIRDALGMTTAQMATRMDVTQPRITELEKAEVHGNITLNSLERAAEALGCRVVYVLVPERPIEQTLTERATKLAERQMTAVEQSMRLEAQEVTNAKQRQAALQKLIAKLLERPARLWDSP
jgi:predicted DNA-binding mobile mystery protein A